MNKDVHLIVFIIRYVIVILLLSTFLQSEEGKIII